MDSPDLRALREELVRLDIPPVEVTRIVDVYGLDHKNAPSPSLKLSAALRSVSRFDTRTLRTQRQQQYIRENGCARSVVCLLFAVVL